MASGISGAGNLQDIDYSIPHRAPPAPPSVASTASPNRSPELTQHHHFQHHLQHHQRQKSSGSGSILKTIPRKNSLGSILRGGSSRAARPQTPEAVAVNNDSLTAPPLPPPPFLAPPIPQDDPNKHLRFQNTATITSAAYSAPPTQPPPSHSFDNPEQERTSTSIFRSRSRSKSRDGKSSNMLRKSSKAKQQQAELERQQREAQMLPKQPPRLPSHNPLPGMPSFGGEDARPDSIAIFNQKSQYSYNAPHTSNNQAHTPVQPTTNLNFSRPGNVAAASAHKDNSSSPAYTLRGASASVSPLPAGGAVENGYDATERTGSMTNRGRYDYTATSAQTGHVNSPRRMRRRKDPTPFNVLVVGTKNSGKSSFISLLNHSLAAPSSKRDAESHSPQTKGNFTPTYLETEMEGERVGLTVWDSPGLEKNIVDFQLREMAAFIESKFEETFAEEQKVMRSPGFRDTHIHCVFLVLDPLRLDANIAGASQRKGGSVASRVGGLDDDVDVQVLRALWEKTVVIPVIAKADTVTSGHMAHLKRAVWQSIKDNSMNPLDALELEEDEDDLYEEDSDVLPEEDEDADTDLPAQNVNGRTPQTPIDNLLTSSSSNSSSSPESAKARPVSKRISHARHASQASIATDEEPYLPLSVLSPDPYTLPKSGHATEEELCRVFPWGSASPLNPQHCDFPRLKGSVFLEWRGDLRELSRTRWYEQWRTSRLRNVPGTKMRIKGGVTPVAAVPKEGRGDVRNFSSGGVGPGGVPRSVSGATQSNAGAGAAPVGMAVSTPASAF